MIRFLLRLGKGCIDTVQSTGELVLVFLECLVLLPTAGIRYRHEIVRQLYSIGVGSIPVILITGSFAGAVFAYTIYNQLAALGVGSWAGAFMAKMLTWHFGPVLIALVLAGRVGCAMTAELGTMKVTEQVDALNSFGVSSTAYLVMPRVLAGVVMAPILTLFAIFIGLLAGMFMIVHIMGGDSHFQWVNIQAQMVAYDYIQGLIKGMVFGLLISLVCCRNGLATRGGAEEVGLATTSANVTSCVLILIVNLLVSIVLTKLEPFWNALVNYLH